MNLKPMKLVHHNGSVGTTPVKVSVNRGIGQYINIRNTHATQTLSVSFDGGRTFFDLDPTDNPVLNTHAWFHYFFVVGSGAATTYQALVGEG